MSVAEDFASLNRTVNREGIPFLPSWQQVGGQDDIDGKAGAVVLRLSA